MSFSPSNFIRKLFLEIPVYRLGKNMILTANDENSVDSKAIKGYILFELQV